MAVTRKEMLFYELRYKAQNLRLQIRQNAQRDKDRVNGNREPPAWVCPPGASREEKILAVRSLDLTHMLEFCDWYLRELNVNQTTFVSSFGRKEYQNVLTDLTACKSRLEAMLVADVKTQDEVKSDADTTLTAVEIQPVKRQTAKDDYERERGLFDQANAKVDFYRTAVHEDWKERQRAHRRP